MVGIVFTACLLALAADISPQEKSSRPGDQRAAVTRHLNMNYSTPFYRTKEEWLARKESLRLQILVAAGLWPAPTKCSLNAQIFSRLDRKGYSIEKVYFESYPGFYVTGNLYRPQGQKGPFPGVLSPHGHWSYGRLQNSELCSVPARCITLAKEGYVVFSYDMVGYNDSRQVDHRIQGERESLWGFSSLGLQLWNSIHSADFLESLPDVDKGRLACTGESGGGTQTFLLAAVDDRIGTSAPVNMISAHMQGGDVCENAPNLRIDTNNVEIGAMMAPRPMIMVSATGDWTKDTLEVEFPAIQRIYKLLGAEDKVSAVQVKADHNYNKESREHVYRWFGRWVLGSLSPESLAEKDVQIEPVTEMLVFYGRDLPQGMKKERQIVEDFVQAADSAVDALKPVDAAGWERFKQAYEPALRFSLMAEYPSEGDVQAFAVAPLQQPAYRVIRFFLSRRGKGDRVPATLWLPGGKSPIRQGVMLLHPKGAEAFELGGAPGALIENLLKQSCSVLVPDLFNTGRASFQRTDKKEFFTTYNRTDDANRIQDILTSLAYLREQAGSLPIKVVGYEAAGLWCLCARALAKDDAWFALDAMQFNAASDDAYLKALDIPGIRRAGDLRSAAILNLRSPLWVSNAGPGFPTSWIQSVYQSLGRGDLLRIDADRAADTAIFNWLVSASNRSK
jgi:dienelactone hydrolase